MQTLLECGDTIAHGGRNRDDFHLGETLAQNLQVLSGGGVIHLVGNDNPGAGGQFVGLEFHFLTQGLDSLHRVVLQAGEVHHKEQQVAAHDVAQELVPQAAVI